MSDASPDLPVSPSGAGTGSDGAQAGAPRPSARPAAPSPSEPGGGAAPRLRGKAFRDAVKAALSKQAAEQRIERGRYTPKSLRPVRPQAGMNRRMPPPSGGAA